ncbi:MAG TPA: hypothetical protein VE781_06640, partial [Kineosporiaceae bacterium]|nr:hypothetical protein [Kineosporiaceae bacterium]
TACTGTAPLPPELAGSPAPTPGPRTSTVAPVPVPSGAARPRLTAQRRIPLRGLPRVVGVRLLGPRVLFAACTDCSRPDDAGALYVHDLAAGRTRRVAVTAFRHGVVLPLGGAGDVVAWADVAPVPLALASRTQWRLVVLDLATGRSRVLAGTDPAERSVPPWTAAGDSLVAWQDRAGDGLSGPVHVADLRTWQVREVPGGAPAPLAGLTADALLYVGGPPAGAPGGGAAGPAATADVYALPLAGGAPRALSSTHDVGGVATDGVTAVWTSPQGESSTVWAAPLGSGAPRPVYSGPTANAVPGDGFVAVMTADEPVLAVAPLAGGPAVTVPDVPDPRAGLASDGPRLAWVAAPDRGVDADGHHPLVLVVAEVR